MTETVKHTPGPWYRGESGVRAKGGYIVFGAKPTRFQDQEARYAEECAQYEADQDLIAAAPDTLAALRELNDALNDGLCNSGIPGFDSGRLGRAQEAADAALAKAEGR